MLTLGCFLQFVDCQKGQQPILISSSAILLHFTCYLIPWLCYNSRLEGAIG